MPNACTRSAHHLRRGSFVVAAICALASSAYTHGSQLVDNGSFRLLVQGEEIGTEEFTIQRLGSGDAQRTFARGQLTMSDGRIFRTVLEWVGPEMAVAAYQATLTGTDSAAIEVLRSGNRFLATVVEPGGERVREYRADPGTAIVEEGMAHHYAVLRRFAASGASGRLLHTFSPLAESPEATLQLTAEAGLLEFAGTTIEATRIRLGSEPDAGAAWFDGSGRLIRVELPASGFLAVRIP